MVMPLIHRDSEGPCRPKQWSQASDLTVLERWRLGPWDHGAGNHPVLSRFGNI